MSAPLLFLLCALSAAFYVAAAAVMKLGGAMPFLPVIVAVYVALGIAAWFESRALPIDRFGMVVLLIIAFEVLITAGVALALGERYSLRETAGLAMIVAGMVVVCAGAPGPTGPAPVWPAAEAGPVVRPARAPGGG